MTELKMQRKAKQLIYSAQKKNYIDSIGLIYIYFTDKRMKEDDNSEQRWRESLLLDSDDSYKYVFVAEN